jgi:hypothetical protein
MAAIPSSRGGPAAGHLGLLDAVRRLRAAERTALLDYLHEGPIQELAAATLALHLMRGAAAPALAERMTALQERLDETARSLRHVIDAQFPPDDMPLARALQGRTAWLLTAPLAVHLAVPPSGHGMTVAPGVAALTVDVTELVLFTLVGGHPPSSAAASIDIGERSVTIDISMSWASGTPLPADLAPVRSALAGLAAGLGSSAQAEVCGRRWRAVIAFAACA